ncbi:glycosyltransferase family 2 protein [Fulvivirga lutea]|uniref:Glycosyltransferase family 2 protein n=1 Tax=Fulvivirga lutea TaxID=2810512 RepID=A0A974WDC8_9BACT|nr:glycosyltransferase family 2 protein [Fulvivirga lutea]QSE95908.1 glycosyltransferase family 2 protein [Fulvivirga lutea]
MQKIDISVVVPLYNEEESLPELCEWVSRVMISHGFSYELILVDDGSDDTSWNVIQELSAKNQHIKALKFNRNYGKSAALNSGFKQTQGSVVITMDADLQDSPDEIPALYKKIKEEGFDMVSGWKKKRHDPITKTIPSKFFNYVTRKISGIKLHDFNCGLKAYRGEMVKHLNVYGEMHRYIPVIAKWNGYRKIGEQVVQHRERKYGTTKFGLERFVNGFLDLLSITFVSRFKRKPMHFFGLLGTLSFFSGFVITCYVIGDKLYKLHNKLPVRDITDQPLFFLALVALVVGVQLFLTGFLAEMLAMKSNSSKDYLVSDSIRVS